VHLGGAAQLLMPVSLCLYCAYVYPPAGGGAFAVRHAVARMMAACWQRNQQCNGVMAVQP
jgi:hypothetical protein